MVSETKMVIDIISQTNRNEKMTINDIVDKPGRGYYCNECDSSFDVIQLDRIQKMNETLEQQIRRLEFCRDCIVLDYDAGKEEYNRLEMVIEKLKKKKDMNKIKKTGMPKNRKVLMTVEEYQAVLLGLSEIGATTGYGNLQEKDISRYKEALFIF